MTGCNARSVLWALLLAVSLVCPSRASAFVRSVNQFQMPKYWTQSCVVADIVTNGFGDLTRDEVGKSVAAAAYAWGPSVVDCPVNAAGASGPVSMDIIVNLASPDTVGRAAVDSKNQVIFETSEWDYDAQALALTVTTTDPSGRIVDADILVNVVSGMTFANLDPGIAPPGHGILRWDLQTVLTHEFGHFLGIAHTCYTSQPGQSSDQADMPIELVDDSGVPIPACSDPPDATNAAAAQSVMWYMIDPEMTTKRTLTADDTRAVCAIYPPSAAPQPCSLNVPNDGCGCDVGSSMPGWAGTAAFAALLARRRRRG